MREEDIAKLGHYEKMEYKRAVRMRKKAKISMVVIIVVMFIFSFFTN